MTALVHNLGLELPVYTEDTSVAWTLEDIKKAAQAETERFVRRACLEYDGGVGSLKKALKLANEALRRIADHVDSGTIDYTWGLYQGYSPIRDRKHDSSRHPLIPPGFSLVADVEILPQAQRLDHIESEELEIKLDDFFVTHRRVYGICDIGAEQFMTRGLGGSQDTVLVDIEPRLVYLH